MNQHRKVAAILLQKLIRRNLVDLHVVLQTYTSGVQNITVESIECLEVVLRVFQLGKTENHLKNTLMKYLLSTANCKEYKYFLHKKTAKFLVNLCLKKWPEAEEHDVREKIMESDITDIHIKSLMETILVLPRKEKEPLQIEYVSHHLDLELFEMLNMIVQNFVANNLESSEILIEMLVLLMNILSYMVEYKVVDENTLENSPLVEHIIKIFQADDVKNFKSCNNDREATQLLKRINNIYIVFTDISRNKQIVSLFRNLVPEELLHSLFMLLTESKGTYISNLY